MKPPFIIAEIGVNHDGSIKRAHELVHCASKAGANAVKFQYFETKRLLSRASRLAMYQQQSGSEDPFAMLRKLELTIEDLSALVNTAHLLNLKAIVTVFSLELVASVERLSWDAYKVASPDVVHRPLIEALRSTHKPILLSTGASTITEVQTAMTWIGENPYALLQCVSAYPTPDENAALNGIRALKKISNAPIGYSDHTLGEDTGALAVACGACILEKHLTHDRAAIGPDHAASLDPGGFANYVRLAHRARAMMGECKKQVLPIEEEVRGISRQSLVTVRDLKAGQLLTRETLTIKRPGSGIPPSQLEYVLGRKLARDVACDTPLVEGDLA